MTTPPTLRLLSLGAGVQSTALLLLAAEGALPKLDGAIFSDTGWEPAAVWEQCRTDLPSSVVDDPRNIAAVAATAARTAVYGDVAEAVRSMAPEHPGNASWVQDCHHIADRLAAAGAELRGAARIRSAALTEAADRLEQANPDRGFEFSEGVDWALDELRRLAAEAHDGGRPSCPDPIECGHEAALGQAQAALARVRRLHDALDAETDLTSPDDEITRGAAARKIAAALDGWTPPAAPAVPLVGSAAPAQDETRVVARTTEA